MPGSWSVDVHHELVLWFRSWSAADMVPRMVWAVSGSRAVNDSRAVE
jgi:hypothetical protein